jgi:2-polyprenyl-6-methoxyphenol hydroxylase-like FAD-dependent oxidoreductase
VQEGAQAQLEDLVQVDAGYCASPLSGQGTSLALVGAYVLAEELGRGFDGALDRYEARMRPFAELNTL